MVDRVGFEPTTYRVRADYSNPVELPIHCNCCKVVLPSGLEPEHCANQAQGLHYRIGG